MAKLLCRLLICVNHAQVAIFSVANVSFNAYCENKILTKKSRFTVFLYCYLHLMSLSHAQGDQCTMPNVIISRKPPYLHLFPYVNREPIPFL